MLGLFLPVALADVPKPAPVPSDAPIPGWLGPLDTRGTLHVHRGQLANGLNVWLQPTDTQSVSASVVFRAGSRWETAETSGVSHLLEHMLFVQTEAWDENAIKAFILDRGGTWNGYTSAERVYYTFRLAADDVDDGLHWLSQVAFHPTLPAEKLDKERDVVLQERGGRENAVMRFFDSLGFGYRISRDLRRALYGENALALDVIGEDASLDGIDIGVVRDFYQRHYGPDNAWLVLAGGLDVGATAASIEQHFGDLAPRGRPDDFQAPELPGRDLVVTARAMDDNDAVGLEIGAVAHGRTHADFWTYKLLGKILSRQLKQEVRHDLGLVYSIHAGYEGFADVGTFSVSTEGARAAIPAIRDAIHRSFERAAAGELTQDQLDHARREYLGQVALALESNEARVTWLGQLVHVVAPDEALPDVRAGVHAVTLDDLARVAGDLWRDGNRFEARRDPILTVASATWAALAVALLLVAVTWYVSRRRPRPQSS